MNFLDNHVHTTFSSDGKDTMEDVIKKAIEIGVNYLTFTDHMEHHGEFSMNFENYSKAIGEYQEKYKEKINILKGIEIGYQSHIKNEINDVINKYPFDFVLCSTHTIDKIDVPTPEFFKGYTKEKAYEKYFESILETVSNFQNFDVYGHLDYVIRYGNFEDNKVIYKDYQDVLDALLRKIIYNDKGIELNTSGIRYNTGHVHPNRSILKRYKELGGDIITMGSDSHKAGDLCADFSKGFDILQSLDYRYVCIFKESVPAFISIEKTRNNFVA